jgi:hypothetical protein
MLAARTAASVGRVRQAWATHESRRRGLSDVGLAHACHPIRLPVIVEATSVRRAPAEVVCVACSAGRGYCPRMLERARGLFGLLLIGAVIAGCTVAGPSAASAPLPAPSTFESTPSAAASSPAAPTPSAAASSPSASAPTPAGPPPMIEGTVTAGPVCPVERASPDPSCAPRPVKGAVIVVADAATKAEVARASTDPHGSYSVVVPQTGALIVTAQPVTGLMGVPAPVTITLRPGEDRRLDLTYDTGIR